MSKVIERFRGEHRWLSNFAPAEIEFQGKLYPTTEHAYQAAKTVIETEREQVRCCQHPGQAKRLARKLTLREDWFDIRDEVMLHVTRLKYARPEYRARLLATGDAEIIEGNTWGDTYWGVCRGRGENRLGKIIMQVRDELRAQR